MIDNNQWLALVLVKLKSLVPYFLSFNKVNIPPNYVKFHLNKII